MSDTQSPNPQQRRPLPPDPTPAEDFEARALAAEAKLARQQLIADSGLPKDLIELIPEGDSDTISAFIEKLKPLAERLGAGFATPPGGITNAAPSGTATNPPNRASSDSARLEQLAAEASRGNKSALREYATLREKLRLARR